MDRWKWRGVIAARLLTNDGVSVVRHGLTFIAFWGACKRRSSAALLPTAEALSRETERADGCKRPWDRKQCIEARSGSAPLGFSFCKRRSSAARRDVAHFLWLTIRGYSWSHKLQKALQSTFSFRSPHGLAGAVAMSGGEVIDIPNCDADPRLMNRLDIVTKTLMTLWLCGISLRLLKWMNKIKRWTVSHRVMLNWPARCVFSPELHSQIRM
jgi:hypothetical protein